MSDPRRPDGHEQRPEWSQPTEQLGNRYPPNADPAYAQPYSYPGYVPPPQNPTEPLPPYWTQTQYPQYPPSDVPPDQPPPGPPKSPRWLWIVAGAAVLLVVGLVIALVIANGSSRQDTVVAPLPPMPEPSSTTSRAPTTTSRTPTTTTAPTTALPGPPTTSTDPGTTENVVYSVTGEGRAISITYVDTGGVLQTEFNVVLPWSRQVSLTSPASSAASVTILNVGREITCSVTVDGVQVRERTGQGLTLCTSIG